MSPNGPREPATIARAAALCRVEYLAYLSKEFAPGLDSEIALQMVLIYRAGPYPAALTGTTIPAVLRLRGADRLPLYIPTSSVRPSMDAKAIVA